MKYIAIILSILLIGRSGFEAISLDGRAFANYHDKNQNIGNSDSFEENHSSFEPSRMVCEINGCSISAVIDTGAEVSIMSENCARRCQILQDIDTRYSGRAIGVGSTEIIGKINQLPIRIGPIQFKNSISILRKSRVDFLIGMDFLRRFKCTICLEKNMLYAHVNDRLVRVPFVIDHHPIYSRESHQNYKNNQQDFTPYQNDNNNNYNQQEDIFNGDNDEENSENDYEKNEDNDEDDYDDDRSNVVAMSLEGV